MTFVDGSTCIISTTCEKKLCGLNLLLLSWAVGMVPRNTIMQVKRQKQILCKINCFFLRGTYRELGSMPRIFVHKMEKNQKLISVTVDVICHKKAALNTYLQLHNMQNKNFYRQYATADRNFAHFLCTVPLVTPFSSRC
jgi:hypothetical protein